jgi:CRP-like cAMP-binding protein
MDSVLSIQELVERYSQLPEAEKARLSALLQAGAAVADEAEPSPSTPPAAEAAGVALLEQVELLRVLDPAQRHSLAERMEAVDVEAGAFIVQEGARDNCLYLLESGDAEVRVTVEGSNVTRPVARLGPGDFFGEMALLTGEPRRASVIAHGPVRCHRLTKADFEDILRDRADVTGAFAAILARRLVELQSVRKARLSFLESISAEERDALLACMREVSWSPGETLVEQGGLDAWMGILISGEADVRVAAEAGGVSRQVATLRAGDFFGEMSLLTGEPRAATIVARTPISCHVLDGPAFEERCRTDRGMKELLVRILAERKRELQSARTSLREDLQQRELRSAETRLRRRIRRFFSLDRPSRSADKLLLRRGGRSAVGRMLFEYKTSSGGDKPLHNMYFELWHGDVIEVFLGCATTARDGTFEVWYDAADLGGRVNLELRVFERRHTYSPEGELSYENALVYTIQGGQGVSQQRYDFGDVRVPYWEYDPASPLPRALVVDQGDPPQEYSPGRSLQMLKVVAPLEVAKRRHLLEMRMTGGSGPSLDKVQRDYPENLTIRLERERPGYTRSDEYFGERMLNGMSAGVFDRDEHDPNQFRVYHHWNSYEHDGIHASPNVDMRFEVRDGKLYPVRITLAIRKPGVTEPNASTEKLTFTPADGERWMQAKRIARVSAAAASEMDNHFATTHVNVEQYAVAAYRNLRKNPVRTLLFPHIKDVVLINHSSNSFLLGPTGFVTRATALTAESWLERILQVLGTLDWKNWRPIQPICETHRYARIANLFWDVLSEYVDEFFDQHSEEIAGHWFEVHAFSQDLVEHSVPDFLCRYLEGAARGRPPEARAWFTADERMDLDVPRWVVDGVPRAVQPVTLSNTPTAADLDNLKQVCRYVVFHATFKHTWANALQYDDGGEILYNGLGLRYGDEGVFVPESDHSVAPPPDQASEQLWISRMLSFAVYGYITKNEDRDIHPAFIEALNRRRKDFEALGFDIASIQSRTNI